MKTEQNDPDHALPAGTLQALNVVQDILAFAQLDFAGDMYMYLGVVIVDFCASRGLAVAGSCISNTSAGLDVRKSLVEKHGDNRVLTIVRTWRQGHQSWVVVSEGLLVVPGWLGELGELG